MKKTALRLFAVALCFLLLLFSCSADKFSYKTVKKSADFGAFTFDGFDGKTANILTESSSGYGFGIGEDESLPQNVEDEILYRNRDTEISLGCEIEIIRADSAVAELRKAHNSGSTAYDLAFLSVTDAAGLLFDGCLANLRSAANLDLDQSAWDADFISNSSDGKRVYFALGDIDLSHYRTAFGTFVNPDLLGETAFNKLQDLVSEGKFTIDKLTEVTSGLYTDYNGNSRRDGEDVYGYAAGYGSDDDAIFGGFNLPLTAFSSDGISLEADLGKISVAYGKIRGLVYGDSVFVSDGIGDVAELFFAGNVAVATLPLYTAEREYKESYSILPLPKSDESQNGYAGSCGTDFSVAVIPTEAGDKTFSGALLMTLALRSERDVKPAYFDSVTNGNYTKNDSVKSNIDALTGVFHFDSAYIYTLCLGNAAKTAISACLRNSESDCTDVYSAIIKSAVSRLPEFNKSYSALP